MLLILCDFVRLIINVIIAFSTCWTKWCRFQTIKTPPQTLSSHITLTQHFSKTVTSNTEDSGIHFIGIKGSGRRACSHLAWITSFFFQRQLQKITNISSVQALTRFYGGVALCCVTIETWNIIWKCKGCKDIGEVVCTPYQFPLCCSLGVIKEQFLKLSCCHVEDKLQSSLMQLS